MTRDDAELGTLKRCPRCDEEWPLDEEFWYPFVRRVGDYAKARGKAYVRRQGVRTWSAYCRACWQERGSARHAQLTPPHKCWTRGCIVIVPGGRRRCHGCERRLAGPLVPSGDALRAWAERQ